jgi:hypothetical protein
MSRVWEKNERRREFIFLKIFEFFCGRFKIRNFYFFSGNSWFTYWSRWRMRVQNKKKKREGNTKNQNWPTGRENGNVAWRIPFAPSGVFVWVPAPCVRVSYDCEHQTFLSLPCAQTIAVCTRRTRWKRFFYLVGGGGLVIGETRRESVAAVSILWVVVCVLLSVCCCLCRKGKIENRTAHFFVFLGVNFEFFVRKIILVEVHLDGYERAQVWRGAATAREWMPAILSTSSTLLKPI